MRYVISIFIIITVLGCRQSKPSTHNILPKDSLINIIVDLHIADVILINPNVQSKISDVSTNRLYQMVLDKYNISKERFTTSINYYAENPEQLDSIYDIVIEKLSIMESKGYTDTLPSSL